MVGVAITHGGADDPFCQVTPRSETLSNSTGKIADAYGQILSTAQRIVDGLFVGLFDIRKRPIYGIVVTYGEITFADTKWYFESFIMPRMASKMKKEVDWFEPLVSPIQVLAVDTFEAFLTVLRGLQESPATLIAKKLTDPEGSDWAPFLFSYGKEIKEWELPLLKKTSSQFFESVAGQQT